jgi:peptidyl-tRNA hydrolase, PTH1 family
LAFSRLFRTGGPGGHNGVKSIEEAFGSRDFVRVRVGVGHPGVQTQVTGHVLGGFTPQEQGGLDDVVNKAAAACFLILSKGVVHAMNQMNSNR